MNRTIAIVLTLLVAAVAGYAGWRSGQIRDEQAAPPARIDAAALGRLKNQALPEASGQTASLAQWQGKVIVVNFWATWCPPCRKEMPLLDAAQKKWGARGVQIVGIGIDEPAAIRAYAKTSGLSFPLLIAGPEFVDITVALGNLSQGLPFSVIIGRDGSVKHTKLGPFKDEALDALIEPLITQ
ncbi:TlpA family protein disulfide reductase [Niveibacterium sp. 24ML]|uniref:TlpA family protein disulfide reductase n=1 Tax=Niveibacterium sp. 24ML TaxID=2985512 RepID=UPI00226D773D|nr:TlpA disulfide reductase family protein [Niveibacterium sp. 24ML]MCX9155525.1 TlpA family protein disulfide reductase [Niveibacterium sp. 24ML]